MKCEYCGKEMSRDEIVFDGYDYCCNNCAEDFCEICGKLITPGTSEAYLGRCSNCKDIEVDEDEY